MMYLGDFDAGATVHLPWNTNGADGASITRATDGSIRIYKDSSNTQRASASGITDTEDFDSLTGVHWVTIDLSDNADAGFYAAGHDYSVVLQGATIDGKAVNAVLATFSIENRHSAAGSAPSAADIADAVCDEDLSGHTTAGSLGKVIADAATQALLTTVASYIDSEVASILAAVDTEVAAIKAKTDNLPAAPAAVGDIPTATDTADAVLSRDIDNVEGTAAIHSLCSAILKAVAKVTRAANVETTYRTDGVTAHMEQTLTPDSGAEPVIQQTGATAA